MEAVVRTCRSGICSAEVAYIISNRAEAYAIERAKKLQIPCAILKTEREIIDFLEKDRVDMICLAGFMKILSPDFVRRFSGKIINIHPSILPAFPGLHSIRQALRAGAKETGVTVHWVDEGVDTGPIVLQEVVPIAPNETEETLTEKIHAVEHRLYPQAIQKVLINFHLPNV